MRFSMCNEFCEGWGFADACRLAADVGYEGIELAPFTVGDSVEELSPRARQELWDTARQCGLHVVGLHWLLARPAGFHLNSCDPSVRAQTVRYLRAEIDFCADVGGSVMVVGSPKQRNVPPGQTYEEVWGRSVRVFQELAEHAQERGVRLCFEPLGPRETNFVCTAAEGRRLVEAVGHPAFALTLDVKAMSDDEAPIPEIIRASVPCLRHFHANDANYRGPGFGDTDYGPIAGALKEVGYEGWVSVEVFDFSAGPETIARESLRHLTEAFA